MTTAKENGLPRGYDARMLAFVRRELEELVRTDVPPLHLEDAVGLVAFKLAVDIVKAYGPPGRALTKNYRASCESIALQIVADSHPKHCLQAGIFPLIIPSHRAEQPTLKWWRKWAGEYVNPNADLSASFSPRKQRILEIAGSIMGGAIDSPEALLANVRAGLDRSWAAHGKPYRDDDEVSDEGVFGAFWEVSAAADKTEALFYIGKNGKIRISDRAVRDKQGRPRDRMVILHEDPHSLSSAEDELASVDSVQAASDAQDAQEVLEVILADLTARTSPESNERVVLENARALLAGMQPTELARVIEKPERTIRECWAKVRERIIQHPRFAPFRSESA